MKSRSVVGRICCEAHQVDVVNRKKKLRKEEVSDLIIKHFCNKDAHGGCGFSLNEIRGAGYWTVAANSAKIVVLKRYFSSSQQIFKATVQLRGDS